MKRLERIARATERRGPHAFGLAWITPRGELKTFRQAGRISDNLGILAMAKDARVLIGHCRYATHGDPAENTNNHPHVSGAGWVVHNGVVSEYREIAAAYELERRTECDSEVLGLLVDELDGPLLERCADAIGQTLGNQVLLGLWTRPRRLVAVRRGNPLYVGTSDEGVYLGSLADGLPAARAVRDDTARQWRFDRKGVIHVDVQKAISKCVGDDPADIGTEALPRSGRTCPRFSYW